MHQRRTDDRDAAEMPDGSVAFAKSAPMTDTASIP